MSRAFLICESKVYVIDLPPIVIPLVTSLPEEKRPDLVLDFELLEKGELGAIYVTEGANRLSRDPDFLVSAKLLKLMKDSNCKLRTSYEVLSPCIDRDREIIHREFERGPRS